MKYFQEFDFLPTDVHDQLLEDVTGSYFSDQMVALTYHGQSEPHKSYRAGNRRAELSPTWKKVFREVFLQQYDRWCEMIEWPASTPKSVEAHVGYAGDGQLMHRHTDNGTTVENNKGRHLSIVYYMHYGLFTGGDLVFDELKARVHPVANSVVVFPPNLVHWVDTVKCPPYIEAGRFTITGFIHT